MPWTRHCMPWMRYCMQWTRYCGRATDMDALLRSGAAPFNDAVTAFRKSPVPGHDLRIAPIGTFALGQVWGKGDVITKPCATARHGFGWWYDANRKRHSKSTLN